MSAQPIAGLDVASLLDVMADYADQLAEADHAARRGTMAVALATEELYESRVWVDEWLQQKPAPARPTNRWKSDSINRFQQWQAWRNEQRGRRALGSRNTYNMVNAAVIARAVPNLQGCKLETTRPLLAWDWLRRNGYANRIPEVWAIAVEMAGAATRVQEEHTRAALLQWKHTHLAGRGSVRAGNNSRMQSKRLKAEATFDDLLFLAQRAENGKTELQAFLHHVEEKLAELRRG